MTPTSVVSPLYPGGDILGNLNIPTVSVTSYDNTTNSDNELTAFKSDTTNQTFDADGNQLTSSTGFTYEYNAWHEMVSSTTSSTNTQYTYNALGQRITIGSGSTMQYQYYSADGQVIETDTVADGTGSAISQYVWGLAYVNDLLVRDDNSTSGSYGGGASSLGRRLFAIEDANFDVTGLVSTSAAVLQRFGYTPYGVRTALTASYTGTTDGYSFEVGFQGGVIDPNTGLIRFGVRDYDPVTGRWTEPEPFGSAYVDGANLYQFGDSRPTCGLDPSGEITLLPFSMWPYLPPAINAQKHPPGWEFAGYDLTTHHFHPSYINSYSFERPIGKCASLVFSVMYYKNNTWTHLQSLWRTSNPRFTQDQLTAASLTQQIANVNQSLAKIANAIKFGTAWQNEANLEASMLGIGAASAGPFKKEAAIALGVPAALLQWGSSVAGTEIGKLLGKQAAYNGVLIGLNSQLRSVNAQVAADSPFLYFREDVSWDKLHDTDYIPHTVLLGVRVCGKMYALPRSIYPGWMKSF